MAAVPVYSGEDETNTRINSYVAMPTHTVELIWNDPEKYEEFVVSHLWTIVDNEVGID